MASSDFVPHAVAFDITKGQFDRLTEICDKVADHTGVVVTYSGVIVSGKPILLEVVCDDLLSLVVFGQLLGSDHLVCFPESYG